MNLNDKQTKALETLIDWSKKTTDKKLDNKTQELLEKYQNYSGENEKLLYLGLSALYIEKKDRDFDTLKELEKAGL